MVSAVVVDARYERDLPRWIGKIKEPMRGTQRPDLHWYLLSPEMKVRASKFLSRLPVRCFTILSHKANMQGHRNILCEERYAWRLYHDGGSYTTVPRKTWFHNFMLKVLLERVTAWCHRRSIRDFGAPRLIDITIGRKGGFSLPDFKTTLEIDRRHFNAGTGTLGRYLAWPVVSLDRIRDEQAAQVAGLQLSDVVCGAFWNAVEEKKFGSGMNEYAFTLRHRMAYDHRSNVPAYYGVTALPWRPFSAPLTEDQKHLLIRYGYSK